MFSELFDRALAFAHQIHRKQKRKVSGTPYITHPLAVAALVIEDGGTEDEAIAALLHDAIEDQSSFYPGGRAQLESDIERQFGPEVRRIVLACTERPSRLGEGEDRRAGWRRHRIAYIEQIRKADERVRRVSCADSISNVRSLVLDYREQGEAIWRRFRTRERDDQLWFYDALATAILETGSGKLPVELDRAVEELHRVVGVARRAQPLESERCV